MGGRSIRAYCNGLVDPGDSRPHCEAESFDDIQLGKRLAAEQRAQEAEAQAAALWRAAFDVEWWGQEERCPSCTGPNPNHRPGCALAAALQADAGKRLLAEVEALCELERAVNEQASCWKPSKPIVDALAAVEKARKG